MGGSALVLYTNAEIELLKLCAWCRDLPAGSTFLNKENLRALTAAGQLRISRNAQSVRITESGKHTLDNLGLHFDYDSKSRGMGNYLIRRLNTAKTFAIKVDGIWIGLTHCNITPVISFLRCSYTLMVRFCFYVKTKKTDLSCFKQNWSVNLVITEFIFLIYFKFP